LKIIVFICYRLEINVLLALVVLDSHPIPLPSSAAHASPWAAPATNNVRKATPAPNPDFAPLPAPLTPIAPPEKSALAVFVVRFVSPMATASLGRSVKASLASRAVAHT